MRLKKMCVAIENLPEGKMAILYGIYIKTATNKHLNALTFKYFYVIILIVSFR